MEIDVRLIGDNEVAIWIEDVPECLRRAPCPMLIAREGRVNLAYFFQYEPPAGWDGQRARVIREDTEDLDCCILSFIGVTEHVFYQGGGDARGHPLEDKGLEPYSLYRIENSRWGWSRAGRTHFIFMFHDSTFECVAESYVCKTARSSVSKLIRSASLRD